MPRTERKLSRVARRMVNRDHARTRVALPVTFADLARTAGVARSTITRAFQPGGPMYPARLSDGTADASAPCVVRWLAEHAGTTPVVVDEPADAVTPAQVARRKGVPLAEVEAAMRPGGALEAAVIRQHHLTAFAFSIVSGVPLFEVIESTRTGSLRPAVTENGRIDLGHEAALALCARNPFPRLPDGDLDAANMPEGLLAPACVGDDIDINNPFARAFLARCIGRVRTAEQEYAEVVAERGT